MTSHESAIEAAKAEFNRVINNPIMDKCERCDGKGYHHGFGENGRDPDWCDVCGGGGYNVRPGEEDRAFEAFISAYLKEMGTEAVAWQPKYKPDVIEHHRNIGSGLWEYAMTVYRTKEAAENYGHGGHEVRPLFVAPSEDIEKLKVERDGARLSAQTIGDKLGNQIERLLRRAESAEAERDAKAALLEEARRVLEPFSRIADAEDMLKTKDGESTLVNVTLCRHAKSFLARLEQSDAAK